MKKMNKSALIFLIFLVPIMFMIKSIHEDTRFKKLRNNVLQLSQTNQDVAYNIRFFNKSYSNLQEINITNESISELIIYQIVDLIDRNYFGHGMRGGLAFENLEILISINSNKLYTLYLYENPNENKIYVTLVDMKSLKSIVGVIPDAKFSIEDFYFSLQNLQLQ